MQNYWKYFEKFSAAAAAVASLLHLSWNKFTVALNF